MRKLAIYNIFPLLAGTMDQWDAWVEHAADLGFSWIYVNNVFAASASGNVFALADPFALNPRFLGSGSPQEESGISRLQRFLQRYRERGLRFMTDFNPLHAAVDSKAVCAHPDWFFRNPDGSLRHPLGPDPLDADTVREWEDLAEFNWRDPDIQEELHAYWETVIRFWVSLGFSGFRCMHATALPPSFWRRMVRTALCAEHGGVLFAADALGEPVEKLAAFRDVFHLLYNSSCWWQFDSPWAVEQHDSLQRFAPTISFPENHDTARLFSRTRAAIAVQRQRCLFAAFFSRAFQMTMGYEYCWQKPCHAVHTCVEDQEDRRCDISPFVRACIRFSDEWPLLCEEGRIEARNGYWEAVLVLRKTVGDAWCELVVNKDWNHGQVFPVPRPCRVCRPFTDSEKGEEWTWRLQPAGNMNLAPAECVLMQPASPEIEG